jgi:CrcB protein
MIELAVVGIGGAIGAVLRYVLSLRIAGLMGTDFPWGTVTVNVLGSFLIGLLAVALEVKTSSPHYVRLGLMVGVLGGLHDLFSVFCRYFAPARVTTVV